MPARDKDSYAIQSVENALDVLEALGDEPEEVRISHLSQRLGLNKTSVFRLLATFERRGYVEREESTGKYRLGISAYEIGQKFLSRMELLRKAKPLMERLARQCNEAVYLAVPRGEDILFLDVVDTTQQVRTVSLVGNRYPLTATAAGRIILAGRDKAPGLAPAERLAILEQGFCEDQGALGDDIASLAVPLVGAKEEHLAALVLMGPSFRMTHDRLAELFPSLRDAGDVISSKLGHVNHYLTQ